LRERRTLAEIKSRFRRTKSWCWGSDPGQQLSFLSLRGWQIEYRSTWL